MHLPTAQTSLALYIVRAPGSAAPTDGTLLCGPEVQQRRLCSATCLLVVSVQAQATATTTLRVSTIEGYT